MAAGEFWDYFDEVDDPRSDRGQRHSAEAIVTIAVVAVLCGADDWVDIADFAEHRRDWLDTFLDLPHGTPAHDTFGRFFAALDAEAFAQALSRWLAALLSAAASGQIAIDGKALRRSGDAADGRSALHLVSAWCREQALTLGQVAAAEKSNEITAIPRLLKLLVLQGAVITIDAMGTQRVIARQIRDGGGEYVLALKGNQTSLHRDVDLFFRDAFARGLFDREVRPLPHARARTVNKRHGRIENRTAWCVGELDRLAAHDWPGLGSVICVRSERRTGGRTTTEDRYFLSSLPHADAARLLELVRGHWSIENALHWSLDVCFREDDSRVRTGHAAANFAALRRLCLSLLKSESSFAGSLKRKRRRCLLDEGYLLTVLRTA